MALVYMSLGTNLGHKADNLKRAAEEINRRIGKVTSLSSVYETAPWGFNSENSFLNAALAVRTSLSPEEVLCLTQDIERGLGRTHKSSNGIYSDRLIDIDILLYDDLVMHSRQLIIPHPHIENRLFVLDPLSEIAPHIIHPLTGLTITQIRRKLKG